MVLSASLIVLSHAQVPRHRIPAYSLFQLSQLAKMQGLRNGPLHRWRGMAEQGGLPAELVQVRAHGLDGVTHRDTTPDKRHCRVLMISRERGTGRVLFFGCEHIYPFLATTVSFVDGYLRCVLSRHFMGQGGVWRQAIRWHFSVCNSIPEGKGHRDGYSHLSLALDEQSLNWAKVKTHCFVGVGL